MSDIVTGSSVAGDTGDDAGAGDVSGACPIMSSLMLAVLGAGHETHGRTAKAEASISPPSPRRSYRHARPELIGNDAGRAKNGLGA